MNKLKLEAAQILENAGLVLSLPEWWTQGVSARDKSGNVTGSLADGACCFCAVGAIVAQRESLVDMTTRTAQNWLDSYCKYRQVDFNDTPGRTNTEVASLLLDAADELRSQA